MNAWRMYISSNPLPKNKPQLLTKKNKLSHIVITDKLSEWKGTAIKRKGRRRLDISSPKTEFERTKNPTDTMLFISLLKRFASQWVNHWIRIYDWNSAISTDKPDNPHRSYLSNKCNSIYGQGKKGNKLEEDTNRTKPVSINKRLAPSSYNIDRLR